MGTLDIIAQFEAAICTVLEANGLTPAHDPMRLQVSHEYGRYEFEFTVYAYPGRDED
jgi:hypothetical protein